MNLEMTTEANEKTSAANALLEARECLAAILLPHEPDPYLDAQMAIAYALIAITERMDRITQLLAKRVLR